MASESGERRGRGTLELVLVAAVLCLSLAVVALGLALFIGTSTLTAHIAQLSDRLGLGNDSSQVRESSKPLRNLPRREKVPKELFKVYQEVSRIMTAGMDKSVDPCVDFYQFMCGNHERENAPGFSWFNLAERKSTQRLTMCEEKKTVEALSNTQAAQLRSVLAKPREYASKVYAQCVNSSLEELVGEMEEVYHALGGFPGLNGSAKYLNPFAAMLRLQRMAGAQMVGDDLMTAEKTQNYIFGFETDVLHLLLGLENLPDSMEKYLNATAGFASVVGWDLGKEWGNRSADLVARSRTLSARISFACAGYQPVGSVASDNATLLMDALRTEFPAGVDLGDRIVLIAKHCVVSDRIQELEAAIGEEEEVIRAAVIGRWLSLWANGTGLKPNWLRRSCPELMRILNEPIFQRIFVQIHGPDEVTRVPVRALIEHIRTRLTNRIFDLAWLDTYSKNRALNKINSIIPRIGYAPWILNDTDLARFYKDLKELDGSENFLTLMTRLWENQWDREMSEFAEKKGALYTQFLANQNTFYVNAAYHAGENTINVQLGIMQPPMFDFGYPVPLMYGVLGFVIAHEITHAVDTIGMFFTLRGEQRKWVSDHSMTKFQLQSMCFVEQYNNFCYPELENVTGVEDALKNCVNGSRVLSENIADDGGMKLSYAAYKDFMFETKNKYIFDIPGNTRFYHSH